METKDRVNKREDPRVDVHIRVDAFTRDLFVSNYMTNISRGGLFIQTEYPLPISSGIHLKFTLPEINMEIESDGKVIWTYDIKKGTGRITPGMGIKFINMTSEQMNLLENYIKKMSAQPELAS